MRPEVTSLKASRQASQSKPLGHSSRGVFNVVARLGSSDTFGLFSLDRKWAVLVLMAHAAQHSHSLTHSFA
jgi:hypothetical protein